MRRASDIPLEAIRLLMVTKSLAGCVRVGNFGQGDNRWSITSETIDRPVGSRWCAVYRRCCECSSN